MRACCPRLAARGPLQLSNIMACSVLPARIASTMSGATSASGRIRLRHDLPIPSSSAMINRCQSVLMAIELKHRYLEHAGRLGRLAVLTLAMGVFLGCAPRWALRLYSDEYGEPLFFIETDRLVVALTIDDGPDPMTTPAAPR